MDLYIWCLNLYFVEIDLYLMSELILLGERDLGPWDPGPNGTRAQMRPGPKWTQTVHGPKQAGPKRDPGPKWAQGRGPGPNGSQAQKLSVVTFEDRNSHGNKIDMAISSDTQSLSSDTQSTAV
jgi:hypothetical protein